MMFLFDVNLNAGRHFEDIEVKQLNIWENQNLSEYVRSQQATQLTSLENRVKETNERFVWTLVLCPFCVVAFYSLRVDVIVYKVDEIAETSFLMQSANSTAEAKLPPALEDRLSYLEQQVNWDIFIYRVSNKESID